MVTVTVRELVGLVRVRVRSWVMYYVYGRPHKDRNVCVCAYVCVHACSANHANMTMSDPTVGTDFARQRCEACEQTRLIRRMF